MLAWEKRLADKRKWRFVRYEKGEPTIYERFRANVKAAKHQNRIIPIIATSIVGMKLILRLKNESRISMLPEVIFLDSAHEETETLAELNLAWQLLPYGGVLFGDDFDWPGVKEDVVKFANQLELSKKNNINKTKELHQLLPRSKYHPTANGYDTLLIYNILWILVK